MMVSEMEWTGVGERIMMVSEMEWTRGVGNGVFHTPFGPSSSCALLLWENMGCGKRPLDHRTVDRRTQEQVWNRSF